MRFPQVAIGQRFTYQGKPYTKTGPLTASEEGSGEQRMIPRAAEVTPLDAEGQPMRAVKQRYSQAEMERLLQGFKSELAEGLKKLALADGTLQLEQALALIASWEPGI